MTTTYGGTGLGQTAVSTRRVSSFFRRYWGAFQERRKERRKRQRERAELYRLNDWELQDIGIARGEIDYVASNRLLTREASDPPDERLISGAGGWPELDTTRRTIPRADFRYGRVGRTAYSRHPLYPHQRTSSDRPGRSV
jgi:uncharacterized protein YjiS (DUF1127 family)